MNTVIIVLGGYLVFIFLVITILNHMTKGLVGAFLRVKVSGGKRVLAVCEDVTDTYFKSAKVQGKELKVKPRDGKIHTFGKLSKGIFHRYMGVNGVNLDIANGVIVKSDHTTTTSYDLTNQDDAVNRALQLPRLGDPVEKIKVTLLIAIIIGILVVGYLIIKQPDMISEKVVKGVVSYLESKSVGSI
jgi:hypothetical protein